AARQMQLRLRFQRTKCQAAPAPDARGARWAHAVRHLKDKVLADAPDFQSGYARARCLLFPTTSQTPGADRWAHRERRSPPAAIGKCWRARRLRAQRIPSREKP